MYRPCVDIQVRTGRTFLVVILKVILSCRPEVIVLDEATSSLDVMTEQCVHGTMASLDHETTSK